MIENLIVPELVKFIKGQQPKFEHGYGLGILSEKGVISELPLQGRADFETYTIDERQTQFYIRRDGEVKQQPIRTGAAQGGVYDFAVPLRIIASSPNNGTVALLAAVQKALAARFQYGNYITNTQIKIDGYETVRPVIFEMEGVEEKANRNTQLAAVSIQFTLSFRYDLHKCETVVLC
jgi:hypothetical protein